MSQPAQRLAFTYDDYLGIRIHVYRRRDGEWWVDNVGPGGRLRLDSVELDCPVETLYEDLSEPLIPNPSPARGEGSC